MRSRGEATASGTGRVKMLAQPIVDLDSGQTVGYEALARGLADEPATALFAAAAARGAVAALDWDCRQAALREALRRGMCGPLTLFVNAEPSTLLSSAPAGFPELVAAVSARMPLMLEVTERELSSHPADLLASLAAARRQGWGIAIDDVGAVDTSLALLPVLKPDVIKLDLSLVQQRTTTEVAGIVSAVRAEAERSGAVLLAEGIETPEQAALAVALGARLGQGFHFGRPAPMPDHPTGVALPLPRQAELDVTGAPRTPWSFVAGGPAIRRAAKPLVLALARHLERQAATTGGVLLATFQSEQHFTPTSAARYESLAQTNALVAAFGEDMPDEPAAAVRRVQLRLGDPLTREWDVLVLGPHFAAGLLAHDVGDSGADLERRFDYVVTHDRDLVVSMTQALLSRVPAQASNLTTPARSTPARSASVRTPAATGLAHGPAVLASLRPADIRLNDALLARAVHASPHGITIAAAVDDLPLVYVNAAFEELSGFRAEMLLGRNCRVLQGPATNAADVKRLGALLLAGREARVTLQNYRPDGSMWWNELFVAPIVDGGGRRTHYIGIQEDVTTRVEADRKVHHLAWHDPLTGSANRSLLFERPRRVR